MKISIFLQTDTMNTLLHYIGQKIQDQPVDYENSGEYIVEVGLNRVHTKNLENTLYLTNQYSLLLNIKILKLSIKLSIVRTFLCFIIKILPYGTIKALKKSILPFYPPIWRSIHDKWLALWKVACFNLLPKNGKGR